MKDYQTLIGAMFIAAAILVSGVLISNSIESAGADIRGNTRMLIQKYISKPAEKNHYHSPKIRGGTDVIENVLF